jgi:uncharacterized protein YciW
MNATETRLSFAKNAEGRLDGARWLEEAQTAPETQGWLQEAACIGQTGRFYSEERSSIAEAVSICRECPVSRLCARYAVEVEQYGTRAAVLGVIAGTIPRERKRFYDLAMRRRAQWAS